MKLVKPDLSYAEQILAYKREMEEHHVSFDGCAGHENTETVQKWLDFEILLKAQYQAVFSMTRTWLQDACNAAGKMQRNRGKQCPADM